VFKKGHVMERTVQARIMKHFSDHKMTTYSPPIVAMNAHSGDPHFENTDANDLPIRKGDFVLVDLWAKMAGRGRSTATSPAWRSSATTYPRSL